MADVRAEGGAASAGEQSGNLTALPVGYSLGKYELLQILGQGSFGITYRAGDSRLGREVAIKEYLPTSLAVRQGDARVLPRATEVIGDFIWGRERFLDEARTLVRLDGVPSIVRVLDYLEANGTAYMVMALVPGEILEARLRRRQTLSRAEIDRLIYPLLDGLEQVHRTGFLHRDIKPANIILDPHGDATLIDFSAARAAMADRTKAMTAIYTPAYAAVEQFTSARQGPWTDIYGLSATLYQCVTGQPPPGALDRVLEDTLVPATTAAQGRYGRALLSAIDAGLGVRMQDRPQSIEEWRAVFTTGMAPVHIDSRTRDMSADPTHATRAIPDIGDDVLPGTDAASRLLIATGDGDLRHASAPASSSTPARRPTPGWPAAAVVILAVGAGGSYLALRPQPPSAGTTGAFDQTRPDLEARRKVGDEAQQPRTSGTAAEERRQAAEVKRKEEEARRATEDEQAQAEADRKKTEDEKARADAEARRLTEGAEASLLLGEMDRKRVQAGLAARGFDTGNLDGSFGPRTRQMIAAFQRGRAEAVTGYLTPGQYVVLSRDGQEALARTEEERAKGDARRRDEEERRVAERVTARPVAAASGPVAGSDGTWSAALACASASAQTFHLQVSNGRGSGGDAAASLALRIDGRTVRADMTLMVAGREYLGTLGGQRTGNSGHAIGAIRAGGGPGMSLDCALALLRGDVAPPVPALVVAAAAGQPETEADGIWSGTLACAVAQPRNVRLQVTNGRGVFNQAGLNMKLRIDGNAIAADLIVQGSVRELIGGFKGKVTGSSARAAGTLIAGGYAAAGTGATDCILTLVRGESVLPANMPTTAPR